MFISSGYCSKSLLFPFEEPNDSNSHFLLKHFSIVSKFDVHSINNIGKLKNKKLIHILFIFLT